ncbi:DUF4886 domain-containing protein [Mariniphaga sediminis]|uniref:DUF4886 domain-containing protein n=1 Tax=Mariniphaga sediminis TaxID=1628158 RepID=UPI003564EE0B
MKTIRQDFIKTFLAFIFLLFSIVGNALTLGKTVEAGRPDTVRLFLIGNSFSQNASRFLPDLAKEGNQKLIIQRAEIGGCSLQKHWELAELAEANPDDPKGRPYRGKSLRMLLSEGTWDIVSLQQLSKLSGNVGTYMPYIDMLYALINELQPDAKVVLHQTWAYRSDSKDFSQITDKKLANSAKKMWKKSRVAYHQMADRLGTDIVPVGDAFWKASSGPYAFRKDKSFNYENPVYPELPNQTNSLHAGYFWGKEKTLRFDSHHANIAGCFLGSLVWYQFLFGESPEQLHFVPEAVPESFADYLKKVANSIVK